MSSILCYNIYMPILYGPDGKPLSASGLRQSGPPRKAPPPGRTHIPRWLSGSVTGLVTLVTVAGFGIALYVMRPILTPSSLENGPFSTEQARLMITNNGQLTMYNVQQSCQATKVVFGGKHTLDAHQFSVLFTQRTVPDVKSGESFPANCVQAWHLLISINKDAGLLAFGDVPIDVNNGTQFIWAFQINPDKSIRVTHTPQPGDRLIPQSFASATEIPVTGIDMSVKTDYELFFHAHRFTRHFRFITQTVSNNGLAWVPVPETQPPIPSGMGGLDLTLSGGPMTVTLVSR